MDPLLYVSSNVHVTSISYMYFSILILKDSDMKVLNMNNVRILEDVDVCLLVFKETTVANRI